MSMVLSIKRFPKTALRKRDQQLLRPGWTDRNLKRFYSKSVKRPEISTASDLTLKKVS